MHSNSVQLSDTETSLRTCTALEIAQLASAGIISTHVHVPHVLATATIYLRAAFISLGAIIVQLLFGVWLPFK